jgi:cytochrome c
MFPAMKPSFSQRLSAVAAALFVAVARAATPTEVLAKIDAATGRTSDTATEFSVTGVVSTRTVLPGGQVVAWVHAVGEAGLPVVAPSTDATLLIPRNEVTLVGKLGDGPLGRAALVLKKDSVKVGITNKSVGAAEVRPPAFFADASALSGRWVQVTNVTFAPDKFGKEGKASVKGEGGELKLLVSMGVADIDVPPGPVNVFGVPVKTADGWALAASRFLPSNAKALQALATQHTCFTCHNPDLKMMGPAYRDVAARYRKDAEALDKLVSQIEKGGTGKWGAVPMPAFGPKVPLEDRKTLSEWVLHYRWDFLLAE